MFESVELRLLVAEIVLNLSDGCWWMFGGGGDRLHLRAVKPPEPRSRQSICWEFLRRPVLAPLAEDHDVKLRHPVRLSAPQVGFDFLERGCHVLPRAWVP